MRFLWKSQLKKERGKFLPQTSEKKKIKREVPGTVREERVVFFGLVCLWVLFFATTMYVAFFSSYLTVSSWQITGLSLVSEEAVRTTVDQELAKKYFGIIPHNTYFLLRPQRLEARLREEYPLLKTVRVERTFPHTLAIEVVEQAELVLWCSNETCAHILENGDTVPVTAVYQRAENQAHTITLFDESGEPVRFGEKIFEPTYVASLLGLRDGLRKRFGIETEPQYFFTSRFANEIRMRTGGWELRLSVLLRPETSLNALALVYGDEIPQERLSQLDYIDLRTENRIFYRYKDQQEEPVVASPVEEAKQREQKKKEE